MNSQKSQGIFLNGKTNVNRTGIGHIVPVREDRSLVSKQLSINYKRVMYLLEPSEAAKKVKGKRVQVYEDESAQVEIRSGALLLPAKAFERVPGALNGAVIENKLLSGALRYIQKQQQERDAQLLTGGRLTKRDKRLLAQRRDQHTQDATQLAAE